MGVLGDKYESHNKYQNFDKASGHKYVTMAFITFITFRGDQSENAIEFAGVKA